MGGAQIRFVSDGESSSHQKMEIPWTDIVSVSPSQSRDVRDWGLRKQRDLLQYSPGHQTRHQGRSKVGKEKARLPHEVSKWIVEFSLPHRHETPVY